MNAAAEGFRGYIASRPIRDERIPQQIQNLVIRDYATRNGFAFKLSATEYAMPGCFMMLNAVMEELSTLEGVILFSMFMLPGDQAARHAVYDQILDQHRELHAALENVSIGSRGDIARFEDILLVDQFAATELPEAV
jgi:sporadic carbohydrate cluster protein (TIGR04323 family)